ncbi:Tad domain-containing protein [Fulvimarina sp. MAC3]|uniref:Tad domain-containing protein n=1 Tax=Fulvimarina sp. MAC3 TaxID=3148887 RepID=UPI0031FC68DF
MLAALAMFPLALVAGGATDLAGAQRAVSNTQHAADIAVLAATKLSGTLSEKRTQADLIFKTNLPKGITVGTPNLQIEGGRHVYTVQLSYKTNFLRLINTASIDKMITAVAATADTPLDVVMVLDSSGSMSSDNRIIELRSAVKLFLDEFTSGGKTQAALVPFDTQIRVDNANFPIGYSSTAGNPYNSTTQCSLLTDPDDKAACEASASLGPAKANCSLLSNSTDRNRCSSSNTGFTVNTSRCYSALLSNTTYWTFEYNGRLIVRKSSSFSLGCLISFDLMGLLSLGQEIYNQPMPNGYRSQTVSKGYGTDTETSNNDLLLNGTNDLLAWSGCIVDRSREYDVLPDPVNFAEKKSIYPQANCSVDTLYPIRGLTNDLTSLKTAVDGLRPSGNTNVTIGIQWGMEVFSPPAPFTSAQADPNVRKVMIVLTDGYNTQNRWWGRDQKDLIDARTALACENAKGTGIELFTINLIGGDEALLKPCASGKDYYFAIQSASELTETFRAIASSVKRIRLVQ